MKFLKDQKLKTVLSILILTNIVTLIFLIKELNTDINHQIKKYPLIDSSRNLIDQENFFSTINPLRKEIIDIVQKYEEEGNEIGLYIEYMNPGANISINQDKRFWPASLSKMPTAFVIMKKIQDGKWSLNNELVLFEDDKDRNFGDLHKEVTGTRFTLEKLLKEMLVNSDNTAHKMLVRNSSSGEYDSMIESLGMEELFNDEYDITAKEYSRIFRALYSASYLDKEHSQLILKWLSETPFTEMLQAGLPSDVVFSHKIGEEFSKSVFLDSGIIYIPERPVLITVMIKVKEGESIEKATEIMKLISEKTYNYVANY